MLVVGVQERSMEQAKIDTLMDRGRELTTIKGTWLGNCHDRNLVSSNSIHGISHTNNTYHPLTIHQSLYRLRLFLSAL